MNKNLFIAIIIIILIAAAALSIKFFSTENNAWICQDGNWVKQGNPTTPEPTTPCSGNNNQAIDPNQIVVEPDIVVDMPRTNDNVSNPIKIEGRARGNWFFEAVFPVTLVDQNKNIIASGNVTATADWITADYVPFKGELAYPKNASGSATLVLEKDNPSGLPENAAKYEIQVVLGGAKTTKVKAFFSNNNLDKEVTCSKVFPIEREVPETQSVARAAVEELLKGITETEKNEGYYTSINAGVKIQKLTIENGTAKVDFDDTIEKNLGGSCRVSAIRAQITETLKQFPTIKNVVISVNGRTEDILQP